MDFDYKRVTKTDWVYTTRYENQRKMMDMIKNGKGFDKSVFGDSEYVHVKTDHEILGGIVATEMFFGGQRVAGWCFGTFFMFHNIWDNHPN